MFLLYFLSLSEENWEFFLKMHMQWRVDHLGEEWNPHRDKIYKLAIMALVG